MSDLKLRVNNVPESAKSHVFWVVRVVDDEMWYFGAYDTIDKATDIAEEIGNGMVLC